MLLGFMLNSGKYYYKILNEITTDLGNKHGTRFKSQLEMEYIHYKGYIKMTRDNFDIFFRRKPALMLVALKKIGRARYGSLLAKEVDCTYSHAVKILQSLEKLGLVQFEKKGRTKLIKLTKKGTEIADNIETIKKNLN
jgi:predicted transcriptional regulator